MSRTTVATIHLAALRHNLARPRELAGGADRGGNGRRDEQREHQLLLHNNLRAWVVSGAPSGADIVYGITIRIRHGGVVTGRLELLDGTTRARADG